jgi:hypothetical protein
MRKAQQAGDDAVLSAFAEQAISISRPSMYRG